MSAWANDTSSEFVSNTINVISYLTLYYFDRAFFGIWMGLLITALSTPSCAQATLEALYPDLHPDEPWSLGPKAKFCIVSRSVLWVSELNRLDAYGLYVLHHAGSILSTLSWLHFRWPNILFLILFTTLVSEIPGDLIFMISAYKDTFDKVVPSLEQFRSQLMWVNGAQYALVRGAGILAVVWMLWTDAPGIRDRPITEQLYGYSLLVLYFAFCTSYVLRHLVNNKPLQRMST